MSFNLFQSVKELFNNEIITQASSFLGEDPTATQKAVDAAIPSLGMGLFDKASTASGSESLLNILKGSNHDGNFLQNLLGTFSGGDNIISKGESVVKNLLGDKVTNVTKAVSQYSGVSASSASSLLSIIAPIFFGVMGRHMNQSGLSSSGLSNLLTSQRSLVSSIIPAGFSSFLPGLGLGNVPAAKAFDATTTQSAPVAEPVRKSSTNWLWPVLILLLLGLVLWYFLGSKKNNNNVAATTDTTAMQTDTATTNVMVTAPKGRVDAATGDYLYDVGNLTDIMLPNNTTIHVGENSTEAKLVNFLNDKNAMVDTAKGNWFEFTNVRFKTGGSQLSDSSIAQLKNFVAIAKAYPKASFKIGGYTDNTGDSSSNLTLSQKRAEAVYAKVLALGASKSAIIGAKGYGPQYPLGDNATTEGRAMNRRVAINVKSK